jgi:hypothetical protein
MVTLGCEPAPLVFVLGLSCSLSYFASTDSSICFGSSVWIVAETHLGIVLDSSDQKTRGFVVRIALPR